MSKTILVLDDEMLIAMDIQSQLEELGHRVFVAANVGTGAEILSREPIDVAIVDWHLRDALSAPLIDLLKQRHIPFVLCSGSALEELAGLFPASPILAKPFASVDLVGALQQVIDGTLVH